jgi:hypothetical protein
MKRMPEVETRFVRLRQAVELGDDVDGWRVCWLGGWDKNRVFYIAMVLRVLPAQKGAGRRGRVNQRST